MSPRLEKALKHHYGYIPSEALIAKHIIEGSLRERDLRGCGNLTFEELKQWAGLITPMTPYDFPGPEESA